MRAEQILTLDIGTDGIRMAVVSVPSSGPPQLIDSGFAVYDAESALSKDAITAMTLRKLLEEKKPGVKRAVVSIEGPSVFSRLVRLPKVGRERVPQTIRHEAVQNIPFPIDDVVWDAHVVDPDSDGPEVLLVAAKAELIDGLVHAVKANGLVIERITAAPVALANLAHACCGTSGPMLLVDGDTVSTNLVFIDGRRAFFRSLPVSGADALRRQQEIERSIAFYTGQQGGRAPEKIVEQVGGVEQGFAVCVGLACLPVVEIDLVPAALADERRMQRRLPLWMASTVVVMLILGVWIFSLGRRTDAIRSNTGPIEAEVFRLRNFEQQLLPLEAEVDALLERGREFRHVARARTQWLEALTEMSRLLPEGMFLLGSEPIENGVRISVVSYLDKEMPGQDSVKLLRDALRASPLFSDETKVESRPSKKEFARRFVLDVYFEGDVS
ncbi:pilus assembly protein PilM [Pontiella agarivorans]|uniref:Pilus assembly protein PilM n=1 Tax=Pontiella agarivorans TaxID=3038953 RepID=A0ABU5MV47_9BACT|nr:pilus assembly protein PilM [Pontiella agarivorans]MDZ8117961.1 pilus assembly protein PilM [Pontiella agarivorans]